MNMGHPFILIQRIKLIYTTPCCMDSRIRTGVDLEENVPGSYFLRFILQDNITHIHIYVNESRHIYMYRFITSSVSQYKSF